MTYFANQKKKIFLQKTRLSPQQQTFKNFFPPYKFDAFMTNIVRIN